MYVCMYVCVLCDWNLHLGLFDSTVYFFLSMQSRLLLSLQKPPGSRKCLTTAANQWRKVISERNPIINAFVYCTPPSAPIEKSSGVLAGVAVAVKDNIMTYDSPTTCSSAMLNGEYSLFMSQYWYWSLISTLDFRIYFAF